MNNNFDQFYNQTAPAVKNAAYYRARAREVLKPCYWYAVFAAFVAGLLGGVSSGGFGGFSFNFNFNAGSGSEEGSMEVEQILEWIRNLDFGAIFDAYPFIPVLLGIGAAASVFGLLFSILVSSPVRLGYQRYCLNVVDGKGVDLSVLFRYFKQSYGKSIGLNILYGLISWACALPMFGTLAIYLFATWKMLAAIGTEQETAAIGFMGVTVLVFMVVSILSALLSMWVTYRFYFCYMIMAEYPEIGVVDALRNSATLMKGNKWRLFCLDFSFIGWILLATCCTCGIGMVFLTPYMTASAAVFYDDITNRTAAKETEFPSINPDDYITE